MHGTVHEPAGTKTKRRKNEKGGFPRGTAAGTEKISQFPALPTIEGEGKIEREEK